MDENTTAVADPPTRRHTLPPELTTVTPVSRALALTLFITLPIVGFWLGTRYAAVTQVPGTPTSPVDLRPRPSPQPPAVSPEQPGSSAVTAPGTADVVAANNQFAFDLYGRLQSAQGNVFFSPYSISSALGMTLEGARGSTADEIRHVFHWSSDNAGRKAATGALYRRFNATDTPYTLRTANALWVRDDYPLLPGFVDTVRQSYGGNVANLDFAHAADDARRTINRWVENRTEHSITDLLAPGTVSADTALVLTNAVYFKGAWAAPFVKGDTQQADFHTDTETVQVDMMQRTGEDARYRYMENDDVQAIELPYAGDALSMLVLLPKHDLATYERAVSPQAIAALRGALREQRVDVYLPKFTLVCEYGLRTYLSALGMSAAFDPQQADLSGIGGTPGLYVSAVVHKAFVDVSEEGTEAAAATGVMTTLGAVFTESPPPVFRADHPFLFFIQDNETGDILFMGRVVNPTLE